MKMKGAKLTKETVHDTFDILGLDKHGMTRLDRKMMKYLARRGSPVGLETLSDLMQMPKKDVKGDIEPYLLRKGFISRRSAGRIITGVGLEAIDLGEK